MSEPVDAEMIEAVLKGDLPRVPLSQLRFMVLQNTLCVLVDRIPVRMVIDISQEFGKYPNKTVPHPVEITRPKYIRVYNHAPGDRKEATLRFVREETYVNSLGFLTVEPKYELVGKVQHIGPKKKKA